jgi:hypothetical protein
MELQNNMRLKQSELTLSENFSIGKNWEQFELYSVAPIRHTYADLVFAIFDEVPQTLCLPEAIRVDYPPIVALLIADFPTTSVGAYREVALFVSAKVGNVSGMFCALNYVTSDVVMGMNREIWGFPTKIAEVELNEDLEYRARVRRESRVLVELTAQFKEAMALEVGDFLNNVVIFNRKKVTSANGAVSQKTTCLNYSLDLTNFLSGSASISLGGELSEYLGVKNAHISMLRALAHVEMPLGKDLGKTEG